MTPTILLAFFAAAGTLRTAPPDSAVVRDIAVAPGETLRTTSVGSGEPLVLIPGIFGAAFGFRSIVGLLAAQGYRCIVVEPLGYGWSSHPKQADYSFSAQTERVAGQTTDLFGSIDAFERKSKAKERESLGDRLHHFTGPVRLLVGTVQHPAEVPDDERELLRERLADFVADTIAGSGQYIHEEQPVTVVAAVAQLHREAGD